MDMPTTLFALRTALWTIGAFYFACGIMFPAWFGEFISFASWDGPRPRAEMHAPKSRYRRIVQGVLLAGIGVFLHATAYPLIDVIPYDWGRHDDGDWVAARDVAQIAAAIVAFVVLAPAIDEIGNKAWLERWHERYGHIK